MASLAESGKYGAINTTDTSTNGFYVIMFASSTYTLQENTTIDTENNEINYDDKRLNN